MKKGKKHYNYKSSCSVIVAQQSIERNQIIYPPELLCTHRSNPMMNHNAAIINLGPEELFDRTNPNRQDSCNTPALYFQICYVSQIVTRSEITVTGIGFKIVRGGDGCCKYCFSGL